MATASIVVYLVARGQRLNGEPVDVVQLLGVRVGNVAGAIFALGLSVFSSYRFGFGAWPSWALGSATAFSSVFVSSCFAAYAAGQRRVTERTGT